MGALIQQLSQFFNLSKLIAVTVPGMLAALALLMRFGPCGTAAAGAAPNVGFDGLIEKISAQVLEFLLLSMVCGMAVDPVQRALFQNENFRKWSFPWFNRKPSRFGDLRYGVLTIRERRLRVDRDFQKTRVENARDELNPNFAIGKGWLLQSEYDALLDQFYRQSQITTGLILPGWLLAYAVFWSNNACGTNGQTVGHFLGWCWWLIPLDLLLQYFGLDRLHQFYSEVGARISGRRSKIEESQADMLITALETRSGVHHLVERLTTHPTAIRSRSLHGALVDYYERHWRETDHKNSRT